MVISKSFNLLKTGTRYATTQKTILGLQQVRHSGYHGKWIYREPKKIPTWGHPEFGYLLAAELGGGLMWWWILYNCYHNYGHIIGEFPYPDTDAWTNVELGVPSTLKQ